MHDPGTFGASNQGPFRVRNYISGRAMRPARERLAIVLVAAVFTGSFLPYVFGLTRLSLLIPVFGLLALCGVALPIIYATRSRRLVESLLGWRLVLFAFVLPITPSIIALGRGQVDPVAYAVLLGAVLIACRVAMGFVRLSGVLQAFALSGAFAVPLFWVWDRHQIFHAIATGSRLIPGATQPNAIAFMFAGFAVVFAWRVLARSSGVFVKVAYGALFGVACLTIFLASSRASMLSLACAGLWVLIMAAARALRGAKVSKGPAVFAAALLIAGVTATVVVRPGYLRAGTTSVVKVLQLESKYRGVGSGLSGRLGRWQKTLQALGERGTWAFGAGYRTSEKEVGFSVDNGYLTVAYEAGVFASAAVALQLLWCLWLSSRYYLSAAGERKRRFALALGGLVTVFVVNNLFDRYLFGIGNPFSVLGLFFLLVSGADMTMAAGARTGSSARVAQGCAEGEMA